MTSVTNKERNHSSVAKLRGTLPLNIIDSAATYARRRMFRCVACSLLFVLAMPVLRSAGVSSVFAEGADSPRTLPGAPNASTDQALPGSTDGTSTELTERGQDELTPGLVFSAPEPPAGDQNQGRVEMYAIARAWPNEIDELAYRNGSWSLRIENRWFAWAEGRLLPEDERDRWMEFDGYRFYRYPLSLPVFSPLSPEAGTLLSARVNERETNPVPRSELFLETLLGAETRRSLETQLVTYDLFGHSFRMHRVVGEALSRVAEDLRRLAVSDPEVVTFFEAIRSIEGYSYREIAGQLSRSYHSYGLALDIIPRSYENRFPYWRWAWQAGIEEWWNLSYEKRWMVPESIVSAFERYGFIWGGKWLYFDSIHFEFRPELLLIARLAELSDSEGAS